MVEGMKNFHPSFSWPMITSFKWEYPSPSLLSEHTAGSTWKDCVQVSRPNFSETLLENQGWSSGHIYSSFICRPLLLFRTAVVAVVVAWFLLLYFFVPWLYTYFKIFLIICVLWNDMKITCSLKNWHHS